MKNKNELTIIIKELLGRLRFVIFSKDISFSVARLLFLKYAVDNSIRAYDIDSMQIYARAQKMFSMRDVETGIDAVVPVLQFIDHEYGLDRILSSQENIDFYASELFGIDIKRQRKNATLTGFRDVMSILGSVDLEEDGTDHECGKAIVDALIDTIVVNSYRSAFTSEYATKESISKLAKELLSVKPTDTFCDFTSGIGMSTLYITKDAMPQVSNAEINRTTAAISAMLYIMYGYEKIELICTDSLSDQIPEIAGNKIFVDPPISVRLEKNHINKFADSSAAALHRLVFNYLDQTEDSIGIMTTPTSLLFQSKPAVVELRSEIVDSGILKAVIALPPLWGGTSMGTNIIVISRKSTPYTVFVNAATATNKRDNGIIIADDIIARIMTAINQEIAIEGFSDVVENSVIKSKGYNLVPANYVSERKKQDDITLAEIDEKLNDLYRQLMNQ